MYHNIVEFIENRIKYTNRFKISLIFELKINYGIESDIDDRL